MKEFEEQGGISFLLIYYKHRDLYYYLTLEKLLEFHNRSLNGGRKSFRLEELDQEYEITCKNSVYIHYLEMLSLDLCSRS